MIFSPISNPLKYTGRGQLLKTYIEDTASRSTLNSLPEGNLPAIEYNAFTFFSTRALPGSFEYLSGPDLSSSDILVKNPTVIIVILVSFADPRSFRYRSTAFITWLFESIACL